MASRREQILDELTSRLAISYPSSTFVRNFFNGNAQVDTMYVYGLPQTSEKDAVARAGQYLCTFPVSVSYWCGCDEKEMQTIGNMHIDRIWEAIEKDRDFSSLCNGYQVTDAGVFWYSPGIIDVEIVLTFDYTRLAEWAKRPLY